MAKKLPPNGGRRPSRSVKLLRRCRYHYFLSYARENHDQVVAPLTAELNKFCIRYFLDRKDISWGDSLHQRISQGLHHSCNFVAIISEQYLAKAWTMLELKAAFHSYMVKRKGRMLLILVGNAQQRERILNRLPFFRDCLFLTWENNASAIAIELAKHICKR